MKFKGTRCYYTALIFLWVAVQGADSGEGKAEANVYS